MRSYQPLVSPRSAQHMIRGIDYHVTQWGDAEDPLLVYLHGWGDTGSTFQFVVDALQKDWHVVAPDWRGFGRSGHAAGGYWFPDYLADLDVLLDLYSPAAPVALIGHSMGGNVAALYSGVNPERVGSFMNIEGFGLSDSDPDDAPERYHDWLRKLRRPPAYSTYKSFAELVPRILKNSPGMPAERALLVAQLWASKNDDGVIRLRSDPAHKLPNPILYRRAEALACWQQITANTILVMGENTRFDSAAQAWLATDDASRPFPGARRVSVPGAGHMLHFEAAEELAELIDKYL